MKYYGNKKFDLIVTLNALNTHQPRPYAGRLGGPWLPIRAASVPKKYGYGLRGHGGPPAGPPNNPPCVAMLWALMHAHGFVGLGRPDWTWTSFSTKHQRNPPRRQQPSQFRFPHVVRLPARQGNS